MQQDSSRARSEVIMSLAMPFVVPPPSTRNVSAADALPPPSVPPMSKRVGRAFGALRKLARDPGQLDQVLILLQSVNARRLAEAVEQLSATEEGRELLENLRRIDRDHVDFDALRNMPDGTLGREYTRFLDD